MRVAITGLIAAAAITTTVFAAGAPTPEPGVLCRIFIGLCAAIMAGQIVPALGMLTGLATPPRAANHR